MSGRYPAGPEYVDKLDGSAESKQRLQAILGTLSGELRLLEACDRLDIGETRFHQLRHKALQAALTAIEPRPAGRPSLHATPEAARVRELQAALADKDLELQQAWVREEVALILPQALTDDAAKKTRRPSAKLRKLKPR